MSTLILSPSGSCLNRNPNQILWETNSLQRRLQARELCSSSGWTDRILLSTGWSGVGGPGPLWHAHPSPPPMSFCPFPLPLTCPCVLALHRPEARSIFRLRANHKNAAANQPADVDITSDSCPRLGFPPACGPLLALDEP